MLVELLKRLGISPVDQEGKEHKECDCCQGGDRIFLEKEIQHIRAASIGQQQEQENRGMTPINNMRQKRELRIRYLPSNR
jgi:hypothetical protein